MAEQSGAARRMWTLFEPVHAVTYFAPESRAAYEAAGVRGFWRGYFAGRAAPLAISEPSAISGPSANGGAGAGGGVGAALVTAAFYNFAPGFVGRAVPGVWGLIPAEEALRVRREGAVAALGRLLAGREQEVRAAAGWLERAVAELDFAGRVLGAANGALGVAATGDTPGGPGPGVTDGSTGPKVTRETVEDPALADDGGAGARAGADAGLARLWQAATTLREHRGDGHFAAVLAAGLDGCEVLVLRCGLDMQRETMQPIRGWSDEEWAAAGERLAGRGLVDAGGAITAAGRELLGSVEAATDRAAERPWARLGDAGTSEAAAALRPLALACAKVVPYPSPTGVPEPDTEP